MLIVSMKTLLRRISSVRKAKVMLFKGDRSKDEDEVKASMYAEIQDHKSSFLKTKGGRFPGNCSNEVSWEPSTSKWREGTPTHKRNRPV